MGRGGAGAPTHHRGVKCTAGGPLGLDTGGTRWTLAPERLTAPGPLARMPPPAPGAARAPTAPVPALDLVLLKVLRGVPAANGPAVPILQQANGDILAGHEQVGLAAHLTAT